MQRKTPLEKPRRRLRGLLGRPRNRRVGGRFAGGEAPPAQEREAGARSAAAELRAATQARRKERSRLRAELRRKRVLGGLSVLGRGALFGLKSLAVLVLLAGVGLAGYLGYQRLLRSTYFDLKQIVINGTRHALPEELLERIEGAKGQSIFKLDLRAVARAVQSHPWVASARVVRQLPRTVRVEVREHHVRAAVLLGHIYLVSDEGAVFKRATAAESEGLPVLTGIERKDFLKDAPAARERVRQGLTALRAYQREIRPALSEVNVGADGEVTFYLRKSGTALRFGKQFTEERLRQLDAVWAALGPDAPRALALYLDHEVRRNRVVVRLAPRETQPN